MRQHILNEIKDRLGYNPETGIVSWKTLGQNRKEVAGSVHKTDGYCRVGIRINGKLHTLLAHRVAWFLNYGCWPDKTIDHINGIKSDNRAINLRNVTQSVNLLNRHKKSTRSRSPSMQVGVNAVLKDGRTVSFMASCTFRGKVLRSWHETEGEAVNKRMEYLNSHLGQLVVDNVRKTIGRTQ